MRTPGFNQRQFEKDSLARAMEKAHDDGAHDEYAQRACPSCDYDGPHPEKRRDT